MDRPDPTRFSVFAQILFDPEKLPPKSTGLQRSIRDEPVAKIVESYTTNGIWLSEKVSLRATCSRCADAGTPTEHDPLFSIDDLVQPLKMKEVCEQTSQALQRSTSKFDAVLDHTLLEKSSENITLVVDAGSHRVKAAQIFRQEHVSVSPAEPRGYRPFVTD